MKTAMTLKQVSAALAAEGVKHVLVVAAQASEAEQFLDLAVPNDYKLWMVEIPRNLKGLDTKATDANLQGAVTQAIKQELARLQREHEVRMKFTKEDFAGFFRDRKTEIREVFDTVQGRRH